MFIWGKISENIEIELAFQFKVFFHLTSNLHTSCFSAFKVINHLRSNTRKTSIFYFSHKPEMSSEKQILAFQKSASIVLVKQSE